MHILLILSYTVAAFLHLKNFTNTDKVFHWQVYSILAFCTALEDIFISYMIIFVLDDQALPTVFHSQERTYAIQDISQKINFYQSTSNMTDSDSSSSTDSEEDDQSANGNDKNQSLSERMLA